MDALINIQHRQSEYSLRVAELREVAIHCIYIITVLVESDDTKAKIVEAEQSLACLNVATDIISSRASLHCAVGSTEVVEMFESQKDSAVSNDDIKLKLERNPETSDKIISDEKAEVEVTKEEPDTEVKTDDEVGAEATNGNVEKKRNDSPPDYIVATSFGTAPQEIPWQKLLIKDDLNLEKAVFSLLRAFSRIQPHRNAMMKNGILTQALKSLAQIEESPCIQLQTDALDLLATISVYLDRSNPGSLSQDSLADLFSSVIESNTRVLQITRDRQKQHALKKLLQIPVFGLQSFFCSLNADSKEKSMRVASDLFVYMADSLFKGSKSRRSMAQKTDGILFCSLASFFMLSIGNDSSRKFITTSRFLSSLIRFVLMTAGLSSIECHIPTASSEGSEYWASALAHFMFCLSCTMNGTSQGELGISFKELIEGVQFGLKPNSFMLCMRYLSENNIAGSTAISARQIMTILDQLPCK